MIVRRESFEVTENTGSVSAIAQVPPQAFALLLMAHGAGAGMTHSFMTAIADRLVAKDLGVLRYQFPYMEAGRKRPDFHGRLTATVRAANQFASEQFPDLPRFAGGKSMGGRMTSRAQAERGLEGIEGLVFLGFPLHPAGKPAQERAEHLSGVHAPMLFLQGTRDRLAELDLLRPVCAALGDRADLHIEEGADHSFHVLKRSGRTDEEVLDSLATKVVQWVHQNVRNQPEQ